MKFYLTCCDVETNNPRQCVSLFSVRELRGKHGLHMVCGVKGNATISFKSIGELIINHFKVSPVFFTRKKAM